MRDSALIERSEIDRQCPAASPLREVVVVIPALNEEVGLAKTLAAIPSVGEVIVVDNGSNDRTAEVARSFGAVVLTEPERGYGAACQRALGYLRNYQPLPWTTVVFLDADFADDPALLPLVAGPVLNDDAEMVIGSRMLGRRERGAMPWHAALGNRVVSFFLRLTTGTRTTDLGPFRAVSLRRLLSLGMQDRRFGWTIEMQIRAAEAGWRVHEIPVPYRRRIGKSKISGTFLGSLRAGTTILCAIARYSTVTLFARLRGWSTSQPRKTAK
jgi:glycosyltransferase involved in cell wall biosynthesis